MPFIAEPSDNKPKYNLVSLDAGYTIAECVNKEWAELLATAANERETRMQRLANVLRYDDDLTMEP